MYIKAQKQYFAIDYGDRGWRIHPDPEVFFETELDAKKITTELNNAYAKGAIDALGMDSFSFRWED